MRRVAVEAILPHYRTLSEAQVEEKAHDDVVTVADHLAEEMLEEGLAAIDPSLAIVGEEAAHDDPSILERLSGDCWIIDPLDGTNNFAKGKPPFGIILARASGGVAEAGWLYDPLNDRLCHTEVGQGAYINGEKITARPAGKEMPIAAISMIFLTPEQQELVGRKLAPHYDLVEIPRCAAEQYPRLALGENDVSSFKRTLAWDHAAGVLWLNEAGGKAARLDGSAYRVDEQDKPGLVGASSPVIWDQFVERVLAPE
ncbi:inositol monophosphatase family protein [Altererythrobacter sp. MF3-039]|uniref:inositol monophosphatase family protein n=1 Tax=Altererythrobacter sp. MF3-039 TaxID=3252901 RepID=UPI00390C9675